MTKLSGRTLYIFLAPCTMPFALLESRLHWPVGVVVFTAYRLTFILPYRSFYKKLVVIHGGIAVLALMDLCVLQY